MDAVSRTSALAGRRIAEDADAMLTAALAGVDPAAWVRRHVTATARSVVIAGERFELGERARVCVVAIGKAAEPTARALVDVLGERVGAGVVVGPAIDEAHSVGPVELLRGGHPLPDAASASAGRRVLEICAQAGGDDLVVFAISGGASALVCDPPDGITLADLRATTDALARAGLDIATTNAVRGRIDRCKHGGLLRACSGRAVALVLVDVPDGDPSVVGSGPTFAPDPTRIDAAVAHALARVGDELPASVRRALARPIGTSTIACPVHVVGDNATAVAAARTEAIARGYAVVQGEPLVGEAREIGRGLLARANLRARARPVACIFGGEPTVTRRGPGRGGRTLELALAAAESIAGFNVDGTDAAIVAFATDGRDGSSDAAGAVVDGTTLARAAARGLDPALALATHDTAPFFAALGDLLHVEPTGTNVCDLVLLLAR